MFLAKTMENVEFVQRMAYHSLIGLSKKSTNTLTIFGIDNSCETNPKPRKELYGRCEEIDREPGRSPLRTDQKNLEPFHELADDFAESFRRPFLFYIPCFLATRSPPFRFKPGGLS